MLYNILYSNINFYILILFGFVIYQITKMEYLNVNDFLKFMMIISDKLYTESSIIFEEKYIFFVKRRVQ